MNQTKRTALSLTRRSSVQNPPELPELCCTEHRVAYTTVCGSTERKSATRLSLAPSLPMATQGGGGSGFDPEVGKSHGSLQQRVVRYFNDSFRLHNNVSANKYDLWENLPEVIACAMHLYNCWVDWLLNHYEADTPSGRLSCNTVLDYFGALLTLAANRFKALGGDATKLFFTCQDEGSTEQAKWMRKLRGKIHNVTCLRTLRRLRPVAHRRCRSISIERSRLACGSSRLACGSSRRGLETWWQPVGDVVEAPRGASGMCRGLHGQLCRTRIHVHMRVHERYIRLRV